MTAEGELKNAQMCKENEAFHKSELKLTWKYTTNMNIYHTDVDETAEDAAINHRGSLIVTAIYLARLDTRSHMNMIE